MHNAGMHVWILSSKHFSPLYRFGVLLELICPVGRPKMVAQLLAQPVYFTLIVHVSRKRESQQTQSWSPRYRWCGLAVAHTHAARLLLSMPTILRTFWIVSLCAHHICCVSPLFQEHLKEIIKGQNGH